MQSPVVIVTGASKGIGRSVATILLKQYNARVVAVARSKDQLEKLREEAATHQKGDDLQIVVGDVTDENIVKQSVKAAVDKWGQLDGVVANAGVLEPVATVAEGLVEDWKRRLFEVNVFSVIRLVQEALPLLRQSKGSIIMVSSGAASKGYRAWGAYGSSKAALNHLASTLSVEEPDVTTIALRPGVVDTEMQGLLRAIGKDAMKDDYQKFVTLHETGQLVHPDQPGRVIASLATHHQPQFSGQFLSWDDEVLKNVA
ncbi:uncharacterized protein BYT42DRAFT_491426 [Radiomyces spectabilis]|uniref:uncharacterized protein n=1 Tax=Radiomyces spectabilis TaxID=64574 RepID=UPI00221F9907|nr:uncharacterized protein BYT42DRAFT_491426 [Radiomyces spectabilis]KAI8388917.1 hypothetical protein BYT42DRAFT_491426 [Radiomyces spectabilis]